MGQSYTQVPTKTKGQSTVIDQLLAQISPNFQQAAQGYQQFLPGGGGGKAITAQANKNFQQQTLPSIMNAFGTGSKNSSALNQALAAGASNLNTDLASQLSQLQLQASQGLGNLAGQQGAIGLQDLFAYMQGKSSPWKGAGAGALGGAAAGAPLGPWGAGAGAVIGGTAGALP
jgi:hypothetical protein